MKCTAFICFLYAAALLQPLQGFGQAGWYLKQNGTWAFVEYSGLDFVNGPAPFSITTSLVAPADVNSQSSAAVSDAAGQLLFYTNSDMVWDRNGNEMPNGAIGGTVVNNQPSPEGSLGGNMNQGVLILPVIDNPNRYYLFALNGLMDICNLWTPLSHQLKYSVVDMTLNNGLGDIIPGMKNITVDSALGGMMTAVRGNGCNIWLIVHDRDNPVYKAYEITPAGVSTAPVLSTTGSFTADWANKWGNMVVSTDRKKLAFASAYNSSAPASAADVGGVELCDFDPASGIVSNAQVITDSQMVMNAGFCWSVCFSPDDSRLYAVLADNVYQYDLTQPGIAAIRNSATLIADTLFGGGGTPSILLGQDGRIYTSSTGVDSLNSYTVAPYLGVINNPNALGTACNFVREGIELSQMPDSLWKGPYWGLGNCNAFDQPIPPDSIYTRTDTFICSNQDSLVLEGHFPAAWTYRWEDSSTTPVKAVYQPGIYWVESSNFCHYQVDTFVVRGVNVSFDLGPDTAICGLSYLLYVPLSQVRYLWQDGSTDSTYTADSSGTYWVQVSSEEGCVNSDSIRLRLIDVTQDLGDDQSICVGDPINVHLAANAPGGASVVWEDHSALPARNVTDTGTYWVRVTDPPCTGSDSVHIGREWCDCNLFVPSAFSPNGDGLNDVFLPVLQDPACQDLGNYALSIYNRYGQKVYEGYIRSRGWDGTVNGSPADAGTYMYFIRYQIGTRAALHVKKGDVTLLR